MNRLAAMLFAAAALLVLAALPVLAPSARATEMPAMKGSSSERPVSALQCGDILKALHLERRDVVFAGCETRQAGDPGGDRLEARYHVAGKDLARVEAWFMRSFHAKPLRFVCCGWETLPVWYTARDGAEYEMSFGGETSIARRKDWGKLPYLTLTVSRKRGAQ